MARSTEAINARLVGIRAAAGEGGGSSDTYETGDQAPGPAEPIAGVDAGCWYEERRQRTIADGRRDVVVWRTLVVSADLRIAWSEGDQVTFRRDDADANETGRVEAIENTPAAPGQAAEVLLTLEPA